MVFRTVSIIKGSFITNYKPLKVGLAVIIALLISVSITPSSGNIMSSDDTTPPVTTHSFNGIKGENGFYITNVEVTLNATDDLSGVNETYYILNVPPVPKIYTGPFWVKGETGHVVLYRSVDNAGNVEKWKEVNIYIDLYPPSVLLWYQMTPQGYKFIAEVDDSASMVERIEFYLDDELMYTVYQGLPEWNSNLTEGGYYVKAIAYDRAGHQDYDEVWVRKSRIFDKGIISGASGQTQIQGNILQSSIPLLLRFLERFPLLKQLFSFYFL